MNDAKDHAHFDANIGGIGDAVLDVADGRVAVAGLEHCGLVDVEEIGGVFPCFLDGEAKAGPEQ